MFEPSRRIVSAAAVDTEWTWSVGRLPGTVWTFGDCHEVSRRHGAFYLAGGVCVFKDTSSNGTWLNGQKVEMGLFYRVEGGDELVFGAPDSPARITVEQDGDLVLVDGGVLG